MNPNPTLEAENLAEMMGFDGFPMVSWLESQGSSMNSTGAPLNGRQVIRQAF
jgi:hypothetical protein